MIDDETRLVAADLGDALLPLNPTVKAMFGGYCYYVDGKVVGVVCDGRIFVKRSSEDGLFVDAAELAPAYPGAKDSWRLALGMERTDPDRLRALIAQVAVALPARRKRAVSRS
jgi:TfoX/Sxy family transcriptional regulator of competence genes